MDLFAFESGVYSLIWLVLTGVKLWALLDAMLRPAQAYLAADKLTKVAWMWILGITMVAHVVFPSLFGLFSLAGIVAAFVYLLDVRPALQSVTRRR